MNVSHIPGPWAPYPQATADHYVLLKDHNWFAAIHFNGEMMEAKQMANLRVMAAAPELMDALIAIVKITDGSQPIDYPGALMVARSAIAKATGATQ